MPEPVPDPIADPQLAGLRRGRAMVVAAALLWSTSGAFVKSPPLAAIPQDSRGPMLACFRALSAAAFLAVFVRPRHMRWRPMLVPFVISFASMNLLYVTAMTRTTAAAAVFLQYTGSGWAFVLSALFLGETIGRRNLAALGCALVGIWWIVAGDWTTQNFAGNWLALASGAGYGGVIVSLKWLRDEDSAWLVALCHTAAGLILLPSVLAAPPSLGPMQWVIVVLFGVLQMGLPYVIFARSLRIVPTQEAALLTLIEPITNPIWVLLLWGESVPPSTWIGGAFIVGGLALRYVWGMTGALAPRGRASPGKQHPAPPDYS
jgi:drug/metabolite transporter, DME family